MYSVQERRFGQVLDEFAFHLCVPLLYSLGFRAEGDKDFGVEDLWDLAIEVLCVKVPPWMVVYTYIYIRIIYIYLHSKIIDKRVARNPTN